MNQAPNYVTAREIVQRITRHVAKDLMEKGGAVNYKHPVGLHADPRCGLSGWAGIGPCCWEKDEPAWFDVYVGERSKHYDVINSMLAEACERIGIPFVNMR